MIVESTVKPEPVEVRKLGVIDDTPVAYIYINTEIKETLRAEEQGEHLIYTYNMEQITTPLSDNVIQQINLDDIKHHSHSQTTEKQLAKQELVGIKNKTKETPSDKLYNVNRRDKYTSMTKTETDTIKLKISKIDEATKNIIVDF